MLISVHNPSTSAMVTKQAVVAAMKFVFPPPKTPAIPVVGSDLMFPVHQIYCVGSNYAEHTREMGGDPDREPPFFLSKPPDAATPSVFGSNTCIPYPLSTQDLHHEVELVVAIGTGGMQISQERALDHVFGYGVGVDLTR